MKPIRLALITIAIMLAFSSCGTSNETKEVAPADTTKVDSSTVKSVSGSIVNYVTPSDTTKK